MASKILPHGGWRSTAAILSFISLLVWAVLEIGWGDSYFRRTLGALVLIAAIITRLVK